MAKVYTSFEERMEWLLAFMPVDDPFAAELLTLVKPQETTEVKTMAVAVVGFQIYLYYNRRFVESLTDPCARGVLSHEMYHLAMHHCTTRRPENVAQRKKHNIAADLETNSLLKVVYAADKSHFKELPDCALLPAMFNLPESLSLEQYFYMLPDSAGKSDDKDNGGKDKDERGNGKGKGSDQGDEDGKGEGNDQGDEDGEDKGNDQGNGQGNDQDNDQKPSGDGDDDEGHGGFDDHSLWSDETNQVVDEMIRQKVQQMENSDRFWGLMPGSVKQRILAAQRSHVAWHKLLRYTLGMIPSKSSVHTIKRPNRRFGYPYCGFKRKCIDRVLLGWDTSGSIAEEELSRFLGEVNRIVEQQPVDVQMFDSTLQGKLTTFDSKIRAVTVEGRGGTSFKEIFDLAEEQRYRTVIMLTDGAAPAIPKPKYVQRIIWAIVGAQNKPPVDWGQVVHIDTIHGQLVTAPTPKT